MIVRFASSSERASNELPYVLFTPHRPPDEALELPLIVFLHGSGERDASSLRNVGLPMLADAGRLPVAEEVLIACPLTSKGMWVEETARVLQLVDELATRRPIDRRRCYLTGISMGGSGSWKIAAADPSRFAAIVPVSGRAYPKGTEEIPARVYHGLWDDSRNRYPRTRRDLWAHGIRRRDNTTLITGWFDGHKPRFWNRVYEDPKLLRWMLAQRRI